MNIHDYKKPLPKRKFNRKAWRKYSKFAFMLILILVAFYTAGKFLKLNISESSTFNRDDVQIRGNHLISAKTIMQLCGFTADNSSAEIDQNRLANKIMELDFVKGVSITFRPPRILNITVEERQPVAFIYGRGLNMIDAEGYLMPVPDLNISWDIPLISGIHQDLGKLGESAVAQQVYLALDIVNYLETEHPLLAGLISEINMGADDYAEIYLVHGGTKIRTNKNSFYRELYILKTYLAKYYDWYQLTQTEYIDLRFANQVIVKNKT